jgi:hypothetical protein
MNNTIQARLLTPLQLKMLDIGAPVIVSCRTLTGETVSVRLQTANLEPTSNTESESENTSAGADGRHVGSCWLRHGVYVAIMPGENWE